MHDTPYRSPWTWDRLLKAARKFGASDVHLVCGVAPAYRVAGRICLAEGPPLTAQDLDRLLQELLTAEERDRFVAQKQLCIARRIEPHGRFRAAVYFRAGVPELCLRVCRESIASREELGLPEVIDELARKPWGLVLIVGPTGMGKTTTLNYMINLINHERRCKIITLEDPVEFEHSNRLSIVVQQEVGTDVDSFYAGLVHALRQDPDVIVVGELREPETIRTALDAAETGHLVLATLHTADTVQTADRIIHAVPPEVRAIVQQQLAGSLQAVIAQRLLPKADGTGRVLACEVCIANTAVRNHIRYGETQKIYSEMQMGRKENMHTLDMALLELYTRGDINYDTAVSHARYPKFIEERLRRTTDLAEPD